MKKGLYESTGCTNCRSQFENDRHALFYFAFAKEVWLRLSTGRKWIQNYALSFRDLMLSLSIKYSIQDVTIFATCT